MDDPLIYDDQIDDLKEKGYHIETGDNYDDCLSDDIDEIIENLPVEQKFSLAAAMEDYRQKYYDVNSTPSMQFDIDDILERYGLANDQLADKLGQICYIQPTRTLIKKILQNLLMRI